MFGAPIRSVVGAVASGRKLISPFLDLIGSGMDRTAISRCPSSRSCAHERSIPEVQAVTRVRPPRAPPPEPRSSGFLGQQFGAGSRPPRRPAMERGTARLIQPHSRGLLGRITADLSRMTSAAARRFTRPRWGHPLRRSTTPVATHDDGPTWRNTMSSAATRQIAGRLCSLAAADGHTVQAGRLLGLWLQSWIRFGWLR
jgi:hypothetical protein